MCYESTAIGLLQINLYYALSILVTVHVEIVDLIKGGLLLWCYEIKCTLIIKGQWSITIS